MGSKEEDYKFVGDLSFVLELFCVMCFIIFSNAIFVVLFTLFNLLLLTASILKSREKIC